MKHIYLFSDASCNPSKNKSIGCYTLVHSLDDNVTDIKTVELDFSSSTLAELHTIKYALQYAHKTENIDEITLYVDCKNFLNLIHKRRHKDNLKKHRNYELYKELIDLVDLHKTNIVWTKGHDKKANKKENSQQIFSLIDKTARKLSRDL